jgi:hypothetical protein
MRIKPVPKPQTVIPGRCTRIPLKNIAAIEVSIFSRIPQSFQPALHGLGQIHTFVSAAQICVNSFPHLLGMRQIAGHAE